jgi:hypothetical protein
MISVHHPETATAMRSVGQSSARGAIVVTGVALAPFLRTDAIRKLREANAPMVAGAGGN